MIRRTRRTAAAFAGTVLLLLTIFFYVPILITEIHTPLAVEGVNYVGDTPTVRSDRLCWRASARTDWESQSLTAVRLCAY